MSPSLSTVALLADPWNVSLVLTGVSLRVYCISRGYCIVVQRNSKQNLNTTGSNSKISIDEQWKEVTHATFFSFSVYLIRLLRQLWYDEHGSEFLESFCRMSVVPIYTITIDTHTQQCVVLNFEGCHNILMGYIDALLDNPYEPLKGIQAHSWILTLYSNFPCTKFWRKSNYWMDHRRQELAQAPDSLSRRT